jgi:hypothetical protein
MQLSISATEIARRSASGVPANKGGVPVIESRDVPN